MQQHAFAPNKEHNQQHCYGRRELYVQYATSFPLDPMRKIVGGGGEGFFFVGCNAFIDNLPYADLRKIAMGETTMQ